MLCFWYFIFKILPYILFLIFRLLYLRNNSSLCFHSWSSIYFIIEIWMRLYYMLLIEYDFIFIGRWNWGNQINFIWIFRVIFNQWKIISFFILTNFLVIIKRIVLFINILIWILFITTILFTFLASLSIIIIIFLLISFFSCLNLSLLQENLKIFWPICFWKVNHFLNGLSITIFNKTEKINIFRAIPQLICLPIN